MKRKSKHGRSFYISTIWTVIIYSVLTLILLGISLSIYLIFSALLIHVFQVEQAIGDMVSLVVSIFFFVLPLIPKIKFFYMKSVNILQQRIYRRLRKRVLPRDLKTTAEQAAVINRALGLLKDEGSHLIALEGAPSKGKTMTAVLLIDNIGRDGNLLELFIQLQQHICYIDAGYEKACLMNFLDDNAIAAKSLTIVDNVHKLSSESLIIVLNKITTVSEYANNIGSKHLIILLYQSIENNDSTSRLLHEYFSDRLPNAGEPFLKLNDDSHGYNFELKINQKIDSDGAILNKLRAEHCDPLCAQLLNIYIYLRIEVH